MKINFLGFRIESEKVGYVDQYLATLPSAHHKGVNISSYPRDIYVKTDDTHVYGLAVTVKDQRKYCELISAAGGDLIIDVKNLAQNSQLMEFNFFAIDRKSGAGIFQHYHNSLSLSGLGHFLQTSYANYNQALVDSEVNKLPKAMQTKDAVKNINNKMRDRLSFKIAVRQEKLKQLLEELKSIKSFEYELATLGVVESAMQPLNGKVKKKSTRLVFNAKTQAGSVAASIASAVSKLDLKKGSIIGTDCNDVESTIRLIDNVGRFSELDYDDALQKIASLNINDFENSWMINQVKDSLKDNFDFISKI